MYASAYGHLEISQQLLSHSDIDIYNQSNVSVWFIYECTAFPYSTVIRMVRWPWKFAVEMLARRKSKIESLLSLSLRYLSLYKLTTNRFAKEFITLPYRVNRRINAVRCYDQDQHQRAPSKGILFVLVRPLSLKLVTYLPYAILR
jgi:hypothetical protein